jgi:hypothetical protein
VVSGYYYIGFPFLGDIKTFEGAFVEILLILNRSDEAEGKLDSIAYEET